MENYKNPNNFKDYNKASESERLELIKSLLPTIKSEFRKLNISFSEDLRIELDNQWVASVKPGGIDKVLSRYPIVYIYSNTQVVSFYNGSLNGLNNFEGRRFNLKTWNEDVGKLNLINDIINTI